MNKPIIPKKPKKGRKIQQRYVKLLSAIFWWKEDFKTGYGWAEHFNIRPSTFVRRLDQYGSNDKRTFYTRGQMKQYIIDCKIKAGIKGGKATKKNKIKTVENKMCQPLDPIKLASDPKFLEQACNFIEHLITDAKKNCVPGKKGIKSVHYDASKSWLKNGNGGLEYLLEYINVIETKKSLEVLKAYAERY